MRMFFYIALLMLCLQGLAQDTIHVVLKKADASCDKGSASVTAAGWTQPYAITWSSGETGASAVKLDPGNASVTITDAIGRDTSLYFSIGEEPCPVGISNHFTPNHDGYDDTWSISNTAHFPNFELIVFNRWGQEVHHQEQVYYPWNGTQHNIDLPDAGYFYIFYFDKSDKNKFLKGDVSILR